MASATNRKDKVRELQRTLYRAAKADPGRRFHALYDKVHRGDVLGRAWGLVRSNQGAAGIDRQTIAEVEQYGRQPLARRTGRGPEGGALASAARAPGVHREARARGAAPALDPDGPRPRRAGRHEAGPRAGVRGGLSAVFVRVSVQALGARRAPGDQSGSDSRTVQAPPADPTVRSTRPLDRGRTSGGDST